MSEPSQEVVGVSLTDSTPTAAETFGSAFAAVAPVADALLYEGYLLYPYRRSSPKNKVRWQFGVLLPQRWAVAHDLNDAGVAGSAESWWQQTECLLLAPRSATVAVRLRFLQQQLRWVERRRPDGGFDRVDHAVVDGRLELSFAEAVPRQYDVVAPVAEILCAESLTPVTVARGRDVEAVSGSKDYRIVRERGEVAATVRVGAGACTADSLVRLHVRVDNVGDVAAAVARDDALAHATLATHVLVAADDGTFVSSLDPPDSLRDEVRACRNVHAFPVLGDATRRVVLSAPVILYDHPQVAPESPGDLHDATEIDEILSLRTMTLTDEEKAEARATDPRAAAIVDRVDAMPPEVLERLHGAIRSLRPAAAPDREQRNWWEPGADDGISPETDCVTIAGVHVRNGVRVRLRPRRHGTDVHDMFLAGRTAVVEKVLRDVDGERHVVVTIDGDPASELNRWYGRYRFFFPDEIEPLEADR